MLRLWALMAMALVPNTWRPRGPARKFEQPAFPVSGRHPRFTPHIFTEEEIARLLAAAACTGPRGSHYGA